MVSLSRLAVSLVAFPLLALVSVPGCGADPAAPAGEPPDERTGTSQSALTWPSSGFLTFGGQTQTGAWPPSSSNNQFCMDIWGDNVAAETIIDSTYCNGTQAQSFVVTQVASQQYWIQAAQNTSLCVNAEAALHQHELRLQPCTSGVSSQLWTPGTDGTWRSVAYGTCMNVGAMAQSQYMMHTTCNGSQGQELWAWGHYYSLELDGTRNCISYGQYDLQDLVLEPCDGRSAQVFEMFAGSVLLTTNLDPVDYPGYCVGYTGGAENGCNPLVYGSNVLAMGGGPGSGYFNCEAYPQPAQQTWSLGAARASQSGAVFFNNFSGKGCLDQCGNNSTVYPNTGFTEPDLYTCMAGNHAQAWNLHFLY